MGENTFWVEIVKAAADVIKGLAWPTFLGLGLFVYRRHIGQILLATVKLIRRMNRVRWGDFELAGKVVETAITAKNEQVEEAADRLRGWQDADPKERARLVNELQQAVAERERLRATLSQLQENHVSYPTMRAATKAGQEAAVHEAWMKLAQSVGVDILIAQSPEAHGETAVLRVVNDRVQTVIQEVENRTSRGPFDMEALKVLERAEAVSMYGLTSMRAMHDLLRAAAILSTAR